MELLSLYSVGIYVIILFCLSAFCIKKALNSYAEYGHCGRGLTFTYIAFTYLATWVGGGTIVGLVAQTYNSGAGQYWVFAISCVVELLFAVIFLKRIRKLQVSSIAGFFALRYPDYGEAVRIPVTTAVLIRNVTMTGMQFSAMAYMLTYLFDMNRNLAVLLIFIIITSYTILSGLWGVVLTDIFQGILQTVAIILLMAFTVKLSGGIDEIVLFFSATQNEDYLNLLNFKKSAIDFIKYIVVFGLFFLMDDQANWVRIYSSKTEKVAFWGFIIPLIVTLIILVIPTYFGVFQRAYSAGVEEPQYVIYSFVFQALGLKVATLILVGLLASIMSSADSFMLASGSIFAEDIIKRFINQEANDREMIFWTRAFVMITGVIGFAFAIIISDLIHLWLSGIGMAAVIVLPPYFMAWFSKLANTKGALAGMLTGICFCAAMALGAIENNVNMFLIGMGCNLAVTTIISGLTKKPLVETVEQTYFFAGKFK
ncbi:sodium:solute symporter family protein [Clostridium aminobutyricum]|uniref:Sodium:solute symporter family protein n=1 Tax=Clostridium aminobutyricum TaxID=33953 RepID=A0A939DAD3_CLOAM|nr:sodium:solute symporter family protein [Clostridium aminobutyricum]MBN7774166.1 sodium:solute symporter family protein [Clostridium aminobutyricum]